MIMRREREKGEKRGGEQEREREKGERRILNVKV